MVLRYGISIHLVTQGIPLRLMFAFTPFLLTYMHFPHILLMWCLKLCPKYSLFTGSVITALLQPTFSVDLSMAMAFSRPSHCITPAKSIFHNADPKAFLIDPSDHATCLPVCYTGSLSPIVVLACILGSLLLNWLHIWIIDFNYNDQTFNLPGTFLFLHLLFILTIIIEDLFTIKCPSKANKLHWT